MSRGRWGSCCLRARSRARVGAVRRADQWPARWPPGARPSAADGLASVASLHAGVFTVVQRFRSDLGLYVHLHLYVPRVI